MILSCNSCGKKFVVPDNAISAAGRLVQCSSCGNKWKQFPIKEPVKAKPKIAKIENSPQKITKITKKRIGKLKKELGRFILSRIFIKETRYQTCRYSQTFQ